MTNRQARREQAKTTRTPRSGGGAPPNRRPTRPGATPPRPSSGPSDFLSKPFLLIAGVLFIVAIGVIGFLAINSGGGDNELAQDIEAGTAALPLDMIDGTKIGSDDAPMKLVAFEDFQCPFCLRFTGEDEPSILEEYVKTGKVQYEFRHLPILGTESAQAAMASECAADQDKFWQYKDRLFVEQARAGQATAERVDAGRFSNGKLKEFATELGLDRTAFDTCLDAGDKLEKVNGDQQEAKNYGITGTPNFLINGQAAGGDPGNIENWRTFLDTNLERIAGAKATQTASAGASPSASAAASTTPAAATTTRPAASATSATSPTAATSPTTAPTAVRTGTP